MKVYISGPITGTKDYLARFAQMESRLSMAGYTVVNPAKVNSMLPIDTTHEEYMALSMVMLEMCDAIMMMDGWQVSKGARMEFDHAVDIGMTVAFEGEKGWQRKGQSKPKRGSLALRLAEKYI